MAMYIQLLCAVLTSGRTDSSEPGELLLGRGRAAVSCSGPPTAPVGRRSGIWPTRSQYDCALIRLCAAEGIQTTPAAFGQPRVERARLERALATTGMDLA